VPTGDRPSAAALWFTIDEFLERAALVLDRRLLGART
jgi:hypothetical protein